MECVNRGFCEIMSESSLGCSSYPPENDFITDNLSEEHNQNISPIYGKENVVDMYLESMAVQNNNLLLLKSHKALLRHDHEKMVDYVKLLSGGATGTDPLYSGSIGQGMLTGAVFGALKKSPPSLTVLEVLRILSRRNRQGILVIVSNNLANRLNFGSACQSAAQEGIKTLLVCVGEDVSGVAVSKTIGRKGLCGIKFLFKIAGAMSEERKTLYEIHRVIEKLKGHSLGTISIQIRPDMMVVGPGCKGEAEKRCFLWNTFDDMGESSRLTFIVKQAIAHLFHPSSYFSLHVGKGDQIAIIVNNLGYLCDLYFHLTIKEILKQLKEVGIVVMRIYSGRFMNSNLPGFSVSVLKLKDNTLELLDRPANVTSWTEKTPFSSKEPKIISEQFTPGTQSPDQKREKIVGPKFSKQDATYLLDVLPKVVETVQDMEEYLNKLDNDHDFGTAINKFAKAIQNEISKRSLKISTPYEFLDQMSYLAGFTMGGVAGGIFSILFSSAAQVFLEAPLLSTVDMEIWINAARAARDGLRRYTRVQPGDKTILDALDPFVESPTEHSVRGLSKRVTAAVKGAEGTTRTASTRTSTSARGSTSRPPTTTVDSSAEGGDEANTLTLSTKDVDPGALCLASVIRTIFTCLQIELAEAESKAQAEVEAKKKDTTIQTLMMEDEMKHGTTRRGSELKGGTKVKEEVLRRRTRLLEADFMQCTKLKGAKLSSKATPIELKGDAALVEEESKHASVIHKEESKHGTKSTQDESKHGSKLTKDESRHGTKLTEDESELSTKLIEDESVHGTKLARDESRLGTELAEGKSVHPENRTKSTKEESKHGTKLSQGESKAGTKLEEGQLKESSSIKGRESLMLEKDKDEDVRQEVLPSPSHGSEPPKEELSENLQQLKEVFDDIAKEIEDEVPGENS